MASERALDWWGNYGESHDAAAILTTLAAGRRAAYDAGYAAGWNDGWDDALSELDEERATLEERWNSLDKT